MAPMPTHPPLSADEFAACMARLGPFEARPAVAVAVSGGADSLALALLAAEWAGGRGGEAVALTVDHRLRPDSGDEAARVAAWLQGRGIRHHILRWDGPKPDSDLQAAARTARYRLLGEWCARHGLLHLLLAHHRGDQAETVLLRLGRGSGVEGLAAMTMVQGTAWGRLLRPLLDTPGERLAATLSSRGQAWVEDPSNRNAAFARVRLRQLAPVLAAEGITVERLAATARRMGRARAALERSVAELAARTVMFHPAGFARVGAKAFAAAPDEVGLRLLARLVLAVGGGEYTPRLERLERLYREVRGGLPAARTLAGCRVVPQGAGLLVCREPAKVAAPVALVPGALLCWDGRFRVEVAADAPTGLMLGALGPRGWSRVVAAMKPHRPPPLPAAIRPTLPVLFGEDGISAVPYVGYNVDTVRATLRSMVLAPALPLTVAGHCLV
jgi:tRNA(Ile)-lysidine synthase